MKRDGMKRTLTIWRNSKPNGPLSSMTNVQQRLLQRWKMLGRLQILFNLFNGFIFSIWQHDKYHYWLYNWCQWNDTDRSSTKWNISYPGVTFWIQILFNCIDRQVVDHTSQPHDIFPIFRNHPRPMQFLFFYFYFLLGFLLLVG